MKVAIKTFKQICVLSIALLSGSGSALAVETDEPPHGPSEAEEPCTEADLPQTLVATEDGEYCIRSGLVRAQMVIDGINLTVKTFLDVPEVRTPHAVRVDIKCWSWQEDNFTTGGSFEKNSAIPPFTCPQDHPVARAEVILFAN